MRELESPGSTAALAFSRRSMDVAGTRESLASQRAPANQYQCKHCHSPLITEPEIEDDDRFLRCLVCGVKNVFVVTVQIVGWRR